MTLTDQLAQELPPSGRYATTADFLAAFPVSDKVKQVAARIIDSGQVEQAKAAIAALQRHEADGRLLTVDALAEAAAAAGVVPEGLARLAVEDWLSETGRTVDPLTGEVVTDVSADKPKPGQLPEAVLDTFRQYYGAGSHHQWQIGRVVDDALAEFAGKISANKILRAAAKEMDLSRSQVLKCQTTWAATDEQLRGEFDMLRFEHFAAVVRHVKDRAQVRQWLTLATDPDAEFNGRFMPAAKLEARIKQALGIGPEEPTAAELLERAIRAVTNYQAVAAGRGHERATRALELLEKVNEQ